MTSPGLLEGLASETQNTTQSLPLVGGETVAVQADEVLLSLFIGVNHEAWLFTSQRLLMLKHAKPLAKQLAGQKLLDLSSGLIQLTLAEILQQARIRREIPVSEIAWIDAERMYSVGAVVLFLQRRKYELTIGHKRAEIFPYVESLRNTLGIPLSSAHQAMKRDLRTWSLFCVLSGSLTFLLSFAYPGMLEPMWGLTVALIGSGVWLSTEPAMFIVLSIGMAWAGMMNLVGLNSSPLSKGHLPLGVPFQIYWALVLFTKYQKYEHLYDLTDDQSNNSPLFNFLTDVPLLPLLSVLIAAAEIVLLSLHFLNVWQWSPASLAMISRGHLHLAMIGIAVGLASLSSPRGQRKTAMTGVAVNATLALMLVVLLLTRWQPT